MAYPSKIHFCTFLSVIFPFAMAQSRTILITGATDGIGKEAAVQLASNPANRVIIHGRNESRCQAAVNAIKQAYPNSKVDYIVADFANLQAVNAMASEVQTRFPRLNVLACNAGVLLQERQVTQNGLEMTFQVINDVFDLNPIFISIQFR